ncbi:biopolymer transporter ExbD [Alistipes sp.]|uniref:biopolymer transporter ExbD n=1 Tax=Alistipes sp. TaxID=1872444 RepID=UPI0023F4A045|nr:biopolymer transporter ExbD [Alistipes sp.]
MKSPLLYILEVLFCSGLLLAFYRLLLVRKVSFRACRRYLVAAVFLSAVIPALDIPLYPARTVVYPLPLIAAPPAENFVQTTGKLPAAGPVVPSGWRRILRPMAVGGYLTAVFLSLGFLAVRMVGIRRLRRRSRLTDCGAYTLAEHPQIATPFSFLRTVFLGGGYEGRRRMIVLCHEAGHVRHRHSAERIAVELVRSLFWFNPFVWIAGRWLQEVHEWEADRDVLDAGYDLTEYRTVIFHQLFGHNPDIACGLNHSFTKKRFAMMTQFRKRRFAVLRLGAAIPVVAAMMMLCSFTVKTPPLAAGDPDRPTVTVHISSGGKILINGRPVTVGDLERLIAAEREKLSEADRAQMEVVLRADKDAPMADLADAMDASRRAHAFRLKLTAEASDPGIVRMLPPDPLRLPADSADYALPATNRNDRQLPGPGR